MRSLRIFAVGTAVVILAFTVRLWAKWGLLAVAALPLVFLVAGQFLFPRSKRSIRVWMNPEVVESLGEVRLRLSGKVVPLGFFKSWHDFRIEVCNFWLLTAIGLLSLGAIGEVWTMSEVPMPGVLLYYGASAWSPVCYVAWRWIWERRAMRKTGIALGPFRVARIEKPFMKRVVYRFNDQQGGYRGGSFRSLFCDTRDDLTVVFYDESDPEISVPASAMMFHRLKWVEAGSQAS
jgi:hypothetical protein